MEKPIKKIIMAALIFCMGAIMHTELQGMREKQIIYRKKRQPLIQKTSDLSNTHKFLLINSFEKAAQEPSIRKHWLKPNAITNKKRIEAQASFIHRIKQAKLAHLTKNQTYSTLPTAITKTNTISKMEQLPYQLPTKQEIESKIVALHKKIQNIEQQNKTLCKSNLPNIEQKIEIAAKPKETRTAPLQCSRYTQTEKPPTKKRRSSKELILKRLDDADIDYEIIKKNNKKVLGITGTVTFSDLRGFTFFCNQCPKDETPAFFMLNLTEKVEKIAREWGGCIISIPGDAYVILFPKKNNEQNADKSLLRAFLCSVEFVCKIQKYMAKKGTGYSPKKIDVGIETGTTYLYKTSGTKLAPFPSVSKIINNAERYESHAKKSHTRKITISEESFKILAMHKSIKKIFTSVCYSNTIENAKFKQLLHGKGMRGDPFVCSCCPKNIQLFYESTDWKKFNKIRKNLTPDICNLAHLL